MIRKAIMMTEIIKQRCEKCNKEASVLILNDKEQKVCLSCLSKADPKGGNVDVS